MRFRTDYHSSPDVKYPQLSPRRPVVLAGSCFADNMSARMRGALWDAANPLGTLFNPISIISALRLVLFSDTPEKDYERSLFEKDDEIRSWLFDSKLAASSREESIKEFMKRRALFLEKLHRGKTLIVTFGTSWCYSRHLGGEPVVGNCHKMPESLFFRWRLDVEDIVASWSTILEKLEEKYPRVEIVFTVSPVRHLKDGFEGNARSKAILLLSTEELCARYSFCSYFPAYELLNDDLRDYRFYASDLTHPSEEAIDYIWEKLCEICVDKEDKALIDEGEKIMAGLNHRPISKSIGEGLSQIEEKRLARLYERIRLLKEKNPEMLMPDFVDF